MTDHKFGTWYPIGELKDFGGDVLFLGDGVIEIGFMHKNSLGNISHRSRDYSLKQVYPSMWMPIPPRPGE
jgi:hypothetical protein